MFRRFDNAGRYIISGIVDAENRIIFNIAYEKKQFRGITVKEYVYANSIINSNYRLSRIDMHVSYVIAQLHVQLQ